jgi:hypothetical protein
MKGVNRSTSRTTLDAQRGDHGVQVASKTRSYSATLSKATAMRDLLGIDAALARKSVARGDRDAFRSIEGQESIRWSGDDVRSLRV